MTLTVNPGPLVVVALVIVGSAFLLGVLVGSEAQKHVLRGHEGTRADTLRRLRAQRAAAVTRRRTEGHGPPPMRVVPAPRSSAGGDRWWRRHPNGRGPVRRSSGDRPPEGRPEL